MPVRVANIIVGAANLYWLPYDDAVDSDTGDVLDLFDDESTPELQYNEAGATQEGLELAFEPDYGEVEVDQFKDAAVVFNQGL